MPVQGFELGVAFVCKDVQRAGKGREAQFLFNQHAQAVDGFSEVNGFTAQVDLVDGAARVHQISACA